jgi:energy-coupling factor transport system ATP-binding protein
MALFQIEHLTFTYPNATAATLTDLSLTVEPGEYLVLCGSSGSGKTTLLRHLKPVLTPHGTRSGQIVYRGAPLEQLDQRTQAAQIGFVMQSPEDQIVTDQVWHELAFGLESLGCDQKTMRLRVAEMASYFGIQDWFHREVAQLSGGQKQLLNLASIMAMQPEVLILDEPTSQLDPIAASDFLNTVRKINQELGTTVILTEHRLEDILPYADRAVVLEGGRIAAQGTPRAVCAQLRQEQHPMMEAMPTPARIFYAVQSEGDCPLTVREGRNWLRARYAEAQPERTEPEEELPMPEDFEPILSLQEVWFRYEKDAPDVLRGLDLKIPQGCLYAIVGGNGAGKSTLLKVACGICKPYRGKVKLAGRVLKSYKGNSLFQENLAMLPQDPKSLFVTQSVRAELEEMSRDSAAIDQVIADCRLEGLLESHPYDLSGGEQQRLALAKVLLTRPRLLLLDEPTKGMDCFFKQQFAAILARLKQQGITMLMVSHDVEFCARYADYVGMCFDGQILTANTPRRFFGQNSFYTTAANRMSRCVFQNAVTVEDVASLCGQGQEAAHEH